MPLICDAVATRARELHCTEQVRVLCHLCSTVRHEGDDSHNTVQFILYIYIYYLLLTYVAFCKCIGVITAC
jgi:hypothetical protein